MANTPKIKSTTARATVLTHFEPTAQIRPIIMLIRLETDLLRIDNGEKIRTLPNRCAKLGEKIIIPDINLRMCFA